MTIIFTMYSYLICILYLIILFVVNNANPLQDVHSPEFRALAKETYEKVLPCIRKSPYLKNKEMNFSFPLDAQSHYEEIKNRTEAYRHAPVHEYAGYSGPWLENIFIQKYLDTPLYKFGGLIPIFVQFIDSQILRGHHFNYIFAELNAILRKDVLYLAISQGDVGLGKIGMWNPNILVMSAGGFGHVILPLVKGELPLQPLPQEYHQDISFFGTINQATRPAMFKIVEDVSKTVNLTFKIGSGPHWKQEMELTRFNLAPRGYGRSSFRFAESIQMGRIPAFLYNDLPWVPYQGTNISVETYGFAAGLTSNENSLPDLVYNFKNITEEEYKTKLEKLHYVRHYFTYDGIFEEVDMFLQDPFGSNGGHLVCTQHPNTERCCGR